MLIKQRGASPVLAIPVIMLMTSFTEPKCVFYIFTMSLIYHLFMIFLIHFVRLIATEGLRGLR